MPEPAGASTAAGARAAARGLAPFFLSRRSCFARLSIWAAVTSLRSGNAPDQLSPRPRCPSKASMSSSSASVKLRDRLPPARWPLGVARLRAVRERFGVGCGVPCVRRVRGGMMRPPGSRTGAGPERERARRSPNARSSNDVVEWRPARGGVLGYLP